MRKSIRKYFVMILVFCAINTSIMIRCLESDKLVNTDINTRHDLQIHLSTPGYNQSDLDELLDGRLSDYNLYGCFQEHYTPSIRDTYFALYALDAIDKLDQINESIILNYITAHYNSTNNEFQDSYSLRFYDLVDSEAFYQNSPLLTYCYAVLSLDIMGELDVLAHKNITNYIWSCHDSDTGGFFGHPTPTTSPQNIPTAENTFFAVKVLNFLNFNWNNYAAQRSQIVSFLNSLQIQSPYNSFTHGGFNNDLEDSVDTVLRYDPNLRSAFFVLITLDSFNMLDVINIENFMQYIEGLYDLDSGCFYYNYFNKISKIYNIFSTALGMELAELIGFTYDDMLSLNFLLNNRMALGGWENTQYLGNYELIDTYEVIRYFKRNGKLSNLNNLTREEIHSFILRFQQMEGFSTLSKDHISLKVIWNTVSAFDINYRISDLNLQELYEVIESAHKTYDFGGLGEGTFYGPVTTNLSSVNYRTAPLEYKGTRNHNYTNEIGFLHSAEHIFYALFALDSIYKLDDFSSANNLSELLEHLVDCQFLEANHSRYGGFIPDYQFSMYSPEYFEDYIYLRYAYFTIRGIEILDSFLYDGNITNNGINLDALYTFISRNTVETSQYLYYDPYYSDDFSDILEDTYHMVYILSAIGSYNLNTQKIVNYILSILDYTDFRDIYYAYRISKILNNSIDFDIGSVRNLLFNLFIEEEEEFFNSYISEIPDTNMIFWICDIAKNDDIRLFYQIDDSATLGYTFHIEASICNLILDDFGPTVTMKLETDKLGKIVLERISENLFGNDILLELDPEHLPRINGYLSVYSGIDKIFEVPMELEIGIDIISNYAYNNNSDTLNIGFEYTISTSWGYTPLSGTDMYADIIVNNTFGEKVSLEPSQSGQKNQYNLTYNFVDDGTYILDFYITHPFLDPEIYDPEVGKKELTLAMIFSNNTISEIPDNSNNNTDIIPSNDDSTDNSDDNSEESNTNYIGEIVTPFVIISSISIGSIIGANRMKKNNKNHRLNMKKRDNSKIKKNNVLEA